MKTVISAALAALILSAGAATAQGVLYRAPAHNFYQNNWMAVD